MDKHKSFKDNPALRFLTPAKEQGQPVPATIQPGFEAKSRRLQLLIKPSLYISLKEKAIAGGISLNELINTILEDFINRGKE